MNTRISRILIFSVIGASCAPNTATDISANSSGSDELTVGNIYTLAAQSTGQALSVLNGNGAVQQNTLDGSPSQQWKMLSQGNVGHFMIQQVKTGFCLDVVQEGTDPLSKLTTAPCKLSDANQQWQLVRLGVGFYQLQNANSALNADVQNNSSATNAPIILATPTTNPNQSWKLGRIATADRAIPNNANPASSIQQTNLRGSDTPVMLRHGAYDYAPAILKDSQSGTYKMWWCAGLPTIGGDHILYAESSSPDGPWHGHTNQAANSYDDVFQPTYNLNDWDGQDVCDPSVLMVGGTYYMYYGGLPIVGSPKPLVTAIGLAKSPDGMSWTRAQPTPIVSAARSTAGLPNTYGAGQPSAIYVNNKFYIGYTDTTGRGVTANGAGTFVLRAADPLFQTSVEELQATGFAPMQPSTHTNYAMFPGLSIDWAYSDVLNQFLLVADDAGNGTHVYSFDANLKAIVGDTYFALDKWFDGSGLAKDPNGHLPTGNTCNIVPIDFWHAAPDGTGATGPNGWDLSHQGYDLVTNTPNGCLSHP